MPTTILQPTPQQLIIQWRPRRAVIFIAAGVIFLMAFGILFVTGAVMTLNCDRSSNQCQLITAYPIGSSTRSLPLDQIQSVAFIEGSRSSTQRVALDTTQGLVAVSEFSSDHPQADFDQITAFLDNPSAATLSMVTQDNRGTAYGLGLFMGGFAALLLLAAFGTTTITFDKSIGEITLKRHILFFNRSSEYALGEITEVRSERVNTGRGRSFVMINLVTSLGKKVPLVQQDKTNAVEIIRQFLGFET